MDAAEKKRRAARAKREKELKAHVAYRRAHPELWPVRKFEMGEEPEEYAPPNATPGECAAMVWQCTSAAWACLLGVTGESPPSYRREEMPGRVIRP